MSKTTTSTTEFIDKDVAAIAAAITTLRVHAEGFVTKKNVRDVGSLIDTLIADLRDVKSAHAKTLRTAQSLESRVKRKERVDRALALLAEQEATEATDAQ